MTDSRKIRTKYLFPTSTSHWMLQSGSLFGIRNLANTCLLIHQGVDLLFATVAIVDIGVINSSINKTDRLQNFGQKVRYFQSFEEGERMTKADYLPFVKSLLPQSVMFMLFALFCSGVCASVIANNDHATMERWEELSDDRSVTRCLRRYYLFHLVHPLLIMSAIIYLYVRARGFNSKTMTFILLIFPQLGTIPRILEIRKIPIQDSPFYVELPRFIIRPPNWMVRLRRKGPTLPTSIDTK